MGTPRETRSCCSDSSRSRLRATATTRIPAAARVSHTAQPMPADAPVTIATWPRHLQAAPQPVRRGGKQGKDGDLVRKGEG